VTILIWGTIATGVMTTFLEGVQLLGLSRMSLPFLFGTVLTGSRRLAVIYGFASYSIGALLFAFFYAFAFWTIGTPNPTIGTLFGFAHGLFLITVVLPNLPYVHPRMASKHDGPTPRRRLEPPGPFGLNYGRLTPLTTVIGQTLFGLLLGWAYAMH
jgi:hypothetical protein